VPLTTGTRLGSYEIISSIGAGGMGEVYRARAINLNRDVALKVLPELFASDPSRRSRFEREAQAVAALSHPNILAIHDYGVDGARAYAVMELLDGETLRERLNAGAIPVRKAVDYSVQIARGLAAAHDKGIIHRDLKPENVIVTREGLVKILDFGLARQMPAAAGGASAATVPQDTTPGTILGTVGYMSPEQVRGEPLDARSDIFAFGSVLYEVLTGRQAFGRDTAAETMTAILREDPPEFIDSRADLSPSLDRIVRHCLEKSREERFQNARDIAFALQALSGSSASVPAITPLPRKRRWIPALTLVAIAAILLAGGVSLGRTLSFPTREATPSFERKTFGALSISNARYGPDGQTVVFSAALEGNAPELFVSRAGSVAPQPLGVRATHLLSISSKGELAVLTDVRFIIHRLFEGTLARMPIDGAPRSWMARVRDADWSPDGSTLAIVRVDGFKDLLEYPIGTKLHETTGYLSDVRVSPDGERVAFMEHQTRYDNRGWVKVVDRAGVVRTLGGEYWGEEGIVWSRDGQRVLYTANDFDGTGYQPHVASVVGDPSPRILMSTPGSVFLFDAFADRWLLGRMDDTNGIRAWLPGATGEREYGWLDQSLLPLLSRDGRTLIFSDESQSAGANYAVAMRKMDGSPVVRLGEGTAVGLSPDGTQVIAQVFTPMQIRLYPTGTGDPVRLDVGTLKTVHTVEYFPDGTRLLACGEEPSRVLRCYALDPSGGPPKIFLPEGLSSQRIAPDGQSLVAAKPDGTRVLFGVSDQRTRPLPGLTGRDEIAAWSDDGAALFVYSSTAVPARLERVDMVSGNRTFVRELAPPDRAGVQRLAGVSLIQDGRAYAYSYWKRFSTLYEVKNAPR
jgi:eukaryotic-like serine/threonine-protein kinase